jgi:hypothetical protein
VTRLRLPDKLSNLGHRQWLVIAVVLVLLLGGALWVGLSGGGHRPPQATPPATAPAAPPEPGDSVDLTGWKLSIPVENDDGNATTVEPAAVTEPWMTPNPGGGLVFWAPSQGATTKNSDHPRTELNSLTNFQAGRGVHTLTASVTLLQVPQDGQGIILGQIHGADDISSVPYVMLRYQDGGLKVVVKQVQDGDQHINYQLLKKVDLNSRFDFTITDSGNGSLTFAATDNGQTQQVVAPIPAEFKGETVRFQAGDYQQADDPAGPRDGGRVIFHRLREDSTSS